MTGDAPLAGAKWRGNLRAALFLAAAALIVLPPAYRQVLGQRSRFVRDWQLFHEVGVGLAVVEFSARAADGTATPIDRYAALGHHDRRLAPRWLRTMVGEEGVLLVARKLCERLGPIDLRARGQLATMAGWKARFADEHDLCRPLPPRPIDPDTRPRSHEDP